MNQFRMLDFAILRILSVLQRVSEIGLKPTLLRGFTGYPAKVIGHAENR